MSAYPPVSWARMNAAVEAVRNRLLRTTAALNAAAVPHLVVGGNAVAAWVARVDESAVRNTPIVELLLRRTDLLAATIALESAGFKHRQIASLGQSGTMEIFLDGPDSRVRDAVHVVFAGERTRPEQPEPNANVEEGEDAGDFRLITLDALVRMKLSAFRGEDRVHLRDLLGVGLIDASWLPRLPETLRRRLEGFLTHPERRKLKCKVSGIHNAAYTFRGDRRCRLGGIAPYAGLCFQLGGFNSKSNESECAVILLCPNSDDAVL